MAMQKQDKPQQNRPNLKVLLSLLHHQLRILHLPESYSSESAMMYGGSGPARTSHREIIQLPVGFELPDGKLVKEAEVRVVTGGDEMYIGQSVQYNRNPNDLVYKTLLLSRCITKLDLKRMSQCLMLVACMLWMFVLWNMLYID